MTWRILGGDCMDRLRELDAGSIQTVVTSPPYWGLRDYGITGQLGLESTPEEYVSKMVEVFREVRRVLRDDGTVWLNMGDSYTSRSPGNHNDPKTNQLAHTVDTVERYCEACGQAFIGGPMQRFCGTVCSGRDNRSRVTRGLPKEKDLVGIPWRLAFALQADGWYLRSDIIWAKPNPMPESVTDRPTKAHEYVFLLTKQARYFYDADAVREPNQLADTGWVTSRSRDGELHGDGQHAQDGNGTARVGRIDSGRNLRSVWNIPTEPFPEAHFATFPKALVEPCIKAGTSEKGCCPECGAAWVREVGTRSLDLSRPQAQRAAELAATHGLTTAHIEAIRAVGITDVGKAQVTQSGFGHNDPDVQRLADEAKEALGGYYREYLFGRPTTTGWRSSCDHDVELVPCTVLDPFAGSGTTGVVALRLGRSFIGIELSLAYAEMARRSLETDRSRDGTGSLLNLAERGD